MSRGVNKVILVGNLGKDPETRYMPSGGAVTTISVATSEGWKDKTTGELQERTEWHRVVFFNRLGEIAGQYLKKGSKIYVEGSLRTNKWQDNNGNDRYTTEVIAREMQMLDGASNNNSNQNSGYQQQPNQNQNQQAPMNQNNQPAQQQQPSQQQQSAATPPPPDIGFDDDIPF